MAEKRLIEYWFVAARIEKLRMDAWRDKAQSEAYRKVEDILTNAPTIDAVPVVRCKDCKFGDWDSEPHDAMVCMRTKDGFWRSGNDFCSFGEQKEGAD